MGIFIPILEVKLGFLYPVKNVLRPSPFFNGARMIYLRLRALRASLRLRLAFALDSEL